MIYLTSRRDIYFVKTVFRTNKNTFSLSVISYETRTARRHSIIDDFLVGHDLARRWRGTFRPELRHTLSIFYQLEESETGCREDIARI
jgi:hypothetical protein